MKIKKPKIAIIGVGLLGGSLALALKKHKGIQLVGWNHRAASRKKAARLLPVAASFEKAVKDADVIVLCSHSATMGPVLRELAPRVRPDALIMDISSVKGEVAGEAKGITGMSRHFVPCHPMAGKEKSGPGHADKELYRGKYVFITPLPGNSRQLIQRAVQFWKKTGALPVVTDPVVHDKAVALTSHLPHLLASAMMALYSKQGSRASVTLKAVGSGFRDFTRIAAGNPAMWRDIVEMNAGAIRQYLFQYRRQLAVLEKNLKKGKGRFWFSFFDKARASRKKLK